MWPTRTMMALITMAMKINALDGRVTSSGQVNLIQDFRYRDTSQSEHHLAARSGLTLNADGTLWGAGESGRFEGVTVVLRDAKTVRIVATTITNANGDYSFGNLPDGTYTDGCD